MFANLKRVARDAIEALGRYEHDWNNVYIGERSNASIDATLPPYNEADIAFCVKAFEPDEDERCPSSQNIQSGHCNHAWSHDACCWCGAEWGEAGVRLDQLTPEQRAAHEKGMATGDWSDFQEFGL